MTETLIALGANLGQKHQALAEAMDRLSRWDDVELLAISQPLETQPIGVPDSDAGFINQAARYRVGCSVETWLTRLLEVEQALGRQRKIRWGARAIDLDLLLFGETVVQSHPLWVPHPRMGFRRFVMQPAVEVAADMWHPVYQATVGRVWQHLNQTPNWILIPASNAAEGTLAILDLEGIEVQMQVGMSLVGWQERFEAGRVWLAERPVSGPTSRVIVVDQWPSLNVLPDPCQPKLAIRTAAVSSIYDDSRFANWADLVRLELMLDSTDHLRHQAEIKAAIEAMVLV